MTTDHTHVTLGHSAAGPLRIDVPTLIGTRGFITASSGQGKSWLMRLLIERIGSRAQVIVIDPEGEFPSLREKLPMLLVGEGGELAADVRTAKLLAHKLLELKLSAVIDLYDLPAEDGLDVWDARRLYVAGFLNGIMNAPKSLYHPVIIAIDEAHQFAPKSDSGETGGVSRRAVNALMSAGRKRGFCGILASQRISKIHNDSIADAKNRFIGGITLDNDQARAADELGMPKAERIQLRDLEPGEFYCYGPALPRGVTRFRTDAVATSHPQPGQSHAAEVPPAPDAIKKLVAELGDLPKQAQAEVDEVAGYQRRVADLEQKLRARPVQMQLAPADKVVERVEVTVFRDGEVGRLEAAVATLATVGNQFTEFGQQLMSAGQQFQAASAEVSGALKAAAARVNAPIKTGPIGPVRPAVPAPSPRGSFQKARGVIGREAAAAQPEGENRKLPQGERLILEALIQYPAGLRREQLTVLTGYKRSSRDTYIQRLRERGYASSDSERVTATLEGIAALPDAQPLPTGQALRDFWLARLPQGERTILEVLIAKYPNGIDRAALDELTPYKRSSRDTYLMRLSAKELVVFAGRGQVRATGELFDD